MAKKKGSHRSLPKVPGSSKFARFSAAAKLQLPSRAVSSVASQASSAAATEPQASSSQAPPAVSVSDLNPESAVCPPQASSSPACQPGLSPPAVEASVSGLAPGVSSPASPSVPTQLGLDKRWTSLFGESSQLEEVGSPSQHISGVPFVLIPDDNILPERNLKILFLPNFLVTLLRWVE